MGREVVQLVTEIVTEQVAAASRKMEADYRASVAGMDRATKAAQAEVDKLGASATNAGRLAMAAGKALSAGIGAATAAAAGAERSWVALGTSILGAFAAGGPIAGGLAIVGAGIGVMAGEAKKAGAAAEEARRAQAKWLDETKAKAAAVAAELAKMRDAIEAARSSRISGSTVDAEDLGMRRDLEAARAAVREAEAARAAAERGRALYLSGGSSSDVVSRGGLFGEDVTRGTFARRTFDPQIQAAENARAAAAAKVKELEDRLGLSAEATAEAMRGQAAAKERTAAAAALAAQREAEAARIGRANAAAFSAADRLRELQFRAGLSDADKPFGSDLLAARDVEAKLAQVRAFADRLRAEQARLAQAAFLDSGPMGQVTRGAIEAQTRAGLASQLGVKGEDVEAEIQRRLQAYASEDSALRRQLEALRAILGLTRETADAEAKRAGAAATLALNRETEALALGNRFRGQTNPLALEIAQLQGAAAGTTDAGQRAAIEQRIQARTAELGVLEAQRQKAEALLALDQRIADLRDPKKNPGLDPAAVERFSAESRASIEAAYAQSVGLATARGVAQAAPAVEDSMRSLLTSIQGTLGQGLTDLLVDGITNGFRNGEQIALGLVRSLLSQVLNSIVASGIQAAFSGLFGGGGGGILGGGGGAPVSLANLVPAAVGATGGSGGC